MLNIEQKIILKSFFYEIRIKNKQIKSNYFLYIKIIFITQLNRDC